MPIEVKGGISAGKTDLKSGSKVKVDVGALGTEQTAHSSIGLHGTTSSTSQSTHIGAYKESNSKSSHVGLDGMSSSNSSQVKWGKHTLFGQSNNSKITAHEISEHSQVTIAGHKLNMGYKIDLDAVGKGLQSSVDLLGKTATQAAGVLGTTATDAAGAVAGVGKEVVKGISKVKLSKESLHAAKEVAGVVVEVAGEVLKALK